MDRVQNLIAQSIGFLRQGAELVGQLDDERYMAHGPGFRHGSVGTHFRHCLDYYTCLLAGVSTGHVDYDARERDEQVEADRAHAAGRLGIVAQDLRALVDEHSAAERSGAGTPGSASSGTPRRAARLGDTPLTVKQDAVASDDAPLHATSTLARELQFAMSHTVHHYALIALILRTQDYEVHPDFGVAPSTLRFWIKSGAADEAAV